MITAPVVTFEPDAHQYALDGVVVPSVTQLLKLGGLVDAEQYYTEASRERGRVIHDLTASFDLGCDVGDELIKSPFRGYVSGYMAAVSALKPTWEAIEEIAAHPAYRFAGRPDRIGQVFDRFSVVELKSAAKAKHHAIQTALQSLLAEHRYGVPARSQQRLVVYVKSSGRYSVEAHEDARDFDTALSLVRRFCQ